MVETGDPFDPWTLCPACNGTGTAYLTDQISAKSATKSAHATRNTALDNHGRQPYD